MARVRLDVVESAAEASVWTRPANALQRARRFRATRDPAPTSRIVAAGWLITFAVVAVQTAGELVDTFVLAHVHPGLDAAVDRNVFDWMSFSAAMAAACSLLVLPASTLLGRGSAVLLALLVAFLAFDDLTNLHDVLSSAFAHSLPQPMDRVADWSTPVVYFPLLVLTFGLLWLRSARVAPAPARQIRAALVLLMADAVLRVLVGIFEISDIHASQGIRALGVTVLEGAELGAWTLVAAALVADGVGLRADRLRRSRCQAAAAPRQRVEPSKVCEATPKGR